MKKSLILIASLSAAMVIAGCSFKKSDGANAQDQYFEETNNKLKAEYQAAEGLYRGKIMRPGYTRGLPIEIRLIVLTVNKTEGSSGKTRQLAVLQGVLTQTESGMDATEMTTTFDSETGRLTLSNSTSDIALIDARLAGGRILGTVKARQGVLGQLQAELFSKSPTQETEAEKQERLRRYYEPVVGIYDSTIIMNFQQGPTEVPVYFTVTAASSIKAQVGASCYSGLFGLAPMVINYMPNEEPPFVAITTTGPGSVCAFSKLEGHFLENGNVQARVTSILGDTQDLLFVKRVVKPQPPTSLRGGLTPGR